MKLKKEEFYIFEKTGSIYKYRKYDADTQMYIFNEFVDGKEAGRCRMRYITTTKLKHLKNDRLILELLGE